MMTVGKMRGITGIELELNVWLAEALTAKTWHSFSVFLFNNIYKCHCLQITFCQSKIF